MMGRIRGPVSGVGCWVMANVPQAGLVFPITHHLSPTTRRRSRQLSPSTQNLEPGREAALGNNLNKAGVYTLLSTGMAISDANF